MEAVQGTAEPTTSSCYPGTVVAQSGETIGTVDAHATVEHSHQAQEDWSFAELSRAETLWGTHGYHRYPAKFIPQLVRRIIERYSNVGDLVADPFLGSATTGVEALRTGRRFQGSDISPVAMMISRAKCLPIESSALNAAWTRLLNDLMDVPHVGRRKLTDDEGQAIKDIDIAHVGASSPERLHYWFPQAHRTALDRIINAIVAIQDGAARTFFLCAFSNILRGCSIWLSGSTKAQKDLDKTLADPNESFRAQVRNMFERNRLYWDDLLNAGVDPTRVPERHSLDIADARNIPWADASVDLLVTSPPYSTCYEYAELHQLTRLWFERHDLIPFSREPQHTYIGSKGISTRNAATQAAPMRTRTTGPGVEPEPAAPTPPTVCDTLGTGSGRADSAIARIEALKNDRSYHSKSINRELRALKYYFSDMWQAIAECARVTAPGKYMVLVIGDSRKLGIDIPTSDAVTEMAEALGFMRECKIQRQIPVRILTITRDQQTGRFSSTERSDAQAYPEEDVLVFKRSTTPSEHSSTEERDGYKRGWR